MLREAVEYALTPCPQYARAMGYLSESIAITARQRRCQVAWQEHLRHTQQFILKIAKQAPRRRRAIILGSGQLLDVPYKELSQMFETVVLVDIVHPLGIKRRLRTYRNCIFHQADISGVARALYQKPTHPHPSTPREFIDDKDVDYVVSVNVLSQLSMLPLRWLKRHADFTDQKLESYGRQLVEAHMQYIQSFACKTALISDSVSITRDLSGNVTEQSSTIHEVELPKPQQQWTWHIAPAPELAKNRHAERQVVALSWN